MFNYKLRGSARLAYLAGSTPQRQFLLAATIPRWWSKHSLQINFFIFFCPSKALQIKTTKRQFPPDSFLHLLTERYIRFWKELRIHHLLYSHILSYKSKMLYGIVSNLAGITPQSRFSVQLHHPLMVFPDLHFTKWIFFLPARLSFKEFTVFWTRTLFAKCKHSFPFSFLPFVSWTLKMAVSNFECKFSLCHSHIHNLNRALVGMWRSTTRVRVTLFCFESGHYLCLLSKMSLLTQLTDLFFTQTFHHTQSFGVHALVVHWASFWTGFLALI